MLLSKSIMTVTLAVKQKLKINKRVLNGRIAQAGKSRVVKHQEVTQ
jgi:hypothetical protein